MQSADNKPADQVMLNTLATMVRDNHATMTAFNEAMQERGELSLRIGRRTTQILRIGVIGMLIINAILFFLVYTLSSEINTMTQSVVTMAGNVGGMEENIRHVAANMDEMNRNIGVIAAQVGQMNQSMQPLPGMAQTMSDLNSRIARIDQTMQGMTGYMSQLSSHTGQISQQMGVMNGNMGQMTYDVDRMARPMRFFPFD